MGLGWLISSTGMLDVLTVASPKKVLVLQVASLSLKNPLRDLLVDLFYERDLEKVGQGLSALLPILEKAIGLELHKVEALIELESLVPTSKKPIL